MADAVAYRAEVIGSLLRPPDVKQAMQDAADRLLLEYDTPRSGTFAPLRLVPDDKVVVLGLISSKEARVETRDEILPRIEEAATFMPLENLALSPRCGFASTLPGNLLGEQEQRRKLELVASVAREVWGPRKGA